MGSREMMLDTGFSLVYFWNLCHASFHASELNVESDKPKRNSQTNSTHFFFYYFFLEKKKSSSSQKMPRVMKPL